jgi:hypothetical protein
LIGPGPKTKSGSEGLPQSIYFLAEQNTRNGSVGQVYCGAGTD